MTELRWGERTYVMGILNLTPDSFSGDGLATEGRSRDEKKREREGHAPSPSFRYFPSLTTVIGSASLSTRMPKNGAIISSHVIRPR